MTVDDREGVVVLTGLVEREEEQFVSFCRELGTTSCGDTIDEALQNLEDAIEVHLAALEETGELGRFLRERNINIILSSVEPPLDEMQISVPLGKILTTYLRTVPAVPA